MSVVLMYHALYADDADLQRIDVEDRPYAVSMSQFRAQLDIVATRSHGVLDEESELLPEVILTFDDGHLSNFDRAMEELVSRDIKAYFFVTTDFIENRESYCNWNHLAEMHSEGMIIGAHGQTHRFFEDMSEQDARTELAESKRVISEAVGHPVSTMSFPGGRCSSLNLRQARETGYSQIFGSNFGTISRQGLFEGSTIRRLPIRNGTTQVQFEKLVNADPVFFAREHTKTALKFSLKKVLGNKLYHGLYKSVSHGR